MNSRNGSKGEVTLHGYVKSSKYLPRSVKDTQGAVLGIHSLDKVVISATSSN